MHLLRMQLVLPFVRHVVSVLDDFGHEEFGVEDAVFFGEHSARDGEDRSEDDDVEGDGSVRGYFEVDEEVVVDDGCEEEDGGEGACYE